jgi:hypothetical protein
MRWLAPILFAAVVACGDEDATGPDRQVELDQAFTIALGEQAAVVSTGLLITFAHVLDDSRCPPQSYCVWLGNATIVLDIERSSDAAELFQVCTNPDICPPGIALDPYELDLIDVDPPSLPRSALEYKVTLRVTAN